MDPPLLDISAWSAERLETAVRNLAKALQRATDSPLRRNDIVRRGILLHTDIAILTPDRAAKLTRVPELRRRGSGYSWSKSVRRSSPAPIDAVVLGSDGQYLGDRRVTAHWAFARMLVDAIRPKPSEDPFVANWYRATTAWFLAEYDLGYAAPHLERALKILPHDPWLLFYAGAMHEALAASRFQNISRSGPPPSEARFRSLDSPREELQRAAEHYRRALKSDKSFAEAHLRLGRVLGLQGHHSDAMEELRRALALTTDPAQRYYATLFQAAELEALGRSEEAREAYNDCATLFPGAQSPLMGLSQLARRQGDRQTAWVELQRLAALPGATNEQEDPWWAYLRQFFRTADGLLDDLRRPFLRGNAQ